MAVTKNGNGNLQNLESQNVQVQMIAADVQVQMMADDGKRKRDAHGGFIHHFQ